MDNSGYTSITIDGEKVDLRFGIPAVRMFLEKVSTEEVLISGETINEVGVAALIYCGYINNCMVKDIVPDKTQGYFLEYVEHSWIDDEVKKQLENVSSVYAASKFTKKVQESVQKNIDEVKKKMTL
jgi:hypothetical protein